MSMNRDMSVITRISVTMLLWVIGVFVSYIGIAFIYPKVLGEHAYDANGNIFTQNFWWWIGGLLVFLITVGVIVEQVFTSTYPRYERTLGFTVLTSVALLSLAVFLTGGYLDSPYSGPVSLYISFFILMIKRKEHPIYNGFLVIFTILLMSWPYYYLYTHGYSSVHIIQWKTTPPVTFSRLGMGIFLSVFGAWVGASVSDQASKITRRRY